MTTETFFEKFELFADTPNAVAKMRELVLELAIRGKLFATESSAPVDSNGPFSIPYDWKWHDLSHVSDCRAGQKVVPSAIDDSDWVLDLEDIDGSAGKVIATATFSERRSLSAKASFVTGDVLYGKLRPYLNKVVIADRPGFCTTEIIPLRPRSIIKSGYLRFFLRSPYFLQYAASRNYGMKMPRLGTKDLETAPIPVPPLEEQKRIVARVDELMGLCDRLEEQQKERETRQGKLVRAAIGRFGEAPTPANLEVLFQPAVGINPSELRKTILTLAVQGKLVAQDPEDGTGSEVLDESDVSAASSDDLPALPDHWIWAQLGDVTTRMDSGWSPACLSEPAREDEWGVLKTTAVQPLEYQEEQNKKLPKNLEPRPAHEIIDGDILFTRAGPMNRVGILCVARSTRPKLMISDKIIRFHLIGGIDPDFAALALNAGHSMTIIEGLKSGMAASQVNISQPKLRSVPIPLPPLAEQRRIVARVEELMRLVDQLEGQLVESRERGVKLMEALVGELTGQ
jgi:type I restriction enzyme S subunit